MTFFLIWGFNGFHESLSLAAPRLPVQCLSNGGGIRKRLKRFCPLVDANFKLRQAVLKMSSNEKWFTHCVGLEGKNQNNLKLKIKIKINDLFVHFLTCFKKSYCEKLTFFSSYLSLGRLAFSYTAVIRAVQILFEILLRCAWHHCPLTRSATINLPH